MTDGSDILRDLDRAVSKARSRVESAASEAEEARQAIIKLQGRQGKAYEEIARERLALLDKGKGGDLGYIDAQAVKRLEEHRKDIAAAGVKISKSNKKQEVLQTQRLEEAKAVDAAVEAYNNAASAAEAKLRKTRDYKAQYAVVSRLSATAERLNAKLKLARADETSKSEPFLNDPYFAYLHGRGFGTDMPKGWFFTRWLDGGVARRTGYAAQAKVYRSITAIPLWLEDHQRDLLEKGQAEEDILHKIESDWLKAEGVTAVHKASILAQKKLDKTDEKIKTEESREDELLAQQAQLIAGKTGPYKEAVRLMTKALSQHNTGSLDRLASQTVTRKDDNAVINLRMILQAIKDRTEDHTDATRLLNQCRGILRDLQSVRQNFKSARYDSYSSAFNGGHKISNMINAVLSGSRSRSSLWKQIKRGHYTVRQNTSDDFGGSVWSSGSRSSRSRSSGGWSSSSSSSRRSSSSSSRSSSSRSSSSRSSSSRGGFSTGGGF